MRFIAVVSVAALVMSSSTAPAVPTVPETVLSVQVQTVTPAMAAAMKLPQPWGVIVSDIDPNGPASKAGVQIGDVILTEDGTVVEDVRRFGAWVCALVITARAASAAPPNQGELLKRAAETINRYCGQLTNIVAEEHYTQRIIQSGESTQSRELVSDFLFVWIPKEMSWVEFRDVYDVDGKPVRDREQRLEKLFIKPDDQRMVITKQIRDESARYNIGRISRNMNVPTLILRVLMPSEQGRFRFSEGGEKKLGETKTAILRFQEVSSPTLVRDPAANQDLLSSGTFWIEPDTGQVVKSEMVLVGAGELRARIVVEYKFVPEIGAWAPAVMEESYDRSLGRITGRATYGNFRRFKVDVKEEVSGTAR